MGAMCVGESEDLKQKRENRHIHGIEREEEIIGHTNSRVRSTYMNLEPLIPMNDSKDVVL